ncbi:hypothetical protein [Giesbergeria anulus]|uniref:hypothetical protein n=1 Tax=Giesbergeria anulus TaxID=180197 RepID=UPI0015A70121|nr:hypothetical protein [Giesbergeria anulus]
MGWVLATIFAASSIASGSSNAAWMARWIFSPATCPGTPEYCGSTLPVKSESAELKINGPLPVIRKRPWMKISPPRSFCISSKLTPNSRICKPFTSAKLMLKLAMSDFGFLVSLPERSIILNELKVVRKSTTSSVGADAMALMNLDLSTNPLGSANSAVAALSQPSEARLAKISLVF